MTSVTLRKCLLGNEVKSGQPTKLCELPRCSNKNQRGRHRNRMGGGCGWAVLIT
jgi:hypothetical protein